MKDGRKYTKVKYMERILFILFIQKFHNLIFKQKNAGNT